MGKYEVHVSDVRAFKSCRRKWHWSSPLGLNLEPDKPYAPFFLGRVIHTALELYYRSNGRMSMYDATDIATTIEREKMEVAGTLWDTEEEMLEENTELAFGMMENYDIWQRSGEQQNSVWGDANLEFLDMETVFTVPLRTAKGNPSSKVFLGGRFDGLVRRRDDNTLWLFESKTTRSIMELQRTLAFDEQAGAYIYAAQELLGEAVYGVVYNIMRKKVPTKPQLLKNGTLSKNKSIDTTVHTYWQAVQDAHPEWTKEEMLEEYNDILQILHEKENKFFNRTIVRRTPQEIEELANNLRIVSLEMTRDNTPLYPSPGWNNCTFCRFTGPCLSMNAGSDYQSILDAEYRQRSDREFRPWLLYGFHFVPIANDRVAVWYYGERIIEGAESLDVALASALNWIYDQQADKDIGYVGPSADDLLRGAKEIGLWQNE